MNWILILILCFAVLGAWVTILWIGCTIYWFRVDIAKMFTKIVDWVIGDTRFD